MRGDKAPSFLRMGVNGWAVTDDESLMTGLGAGCAIGGAAGAGKTMMV